MTAKKWVERLSLMPHPEGGFFREIYRSEDTFMLSSGPEGEPSPRSMSTAIYFLLCKGNHSRFHRLKSDEVWHHYDGAAVALHSITPEGDLKTVLLGKEEEMTVVPQIVMPKGTWFAAEVANDGDYALVGCTVAPGFDFLDFELADHSFYEMYPFDTVRRLL